jgi:DNA-binding PadR family transcriptional regulator
MGNLYRFVEPVVLLLLKQKGISYGYDLSGNLQSYALTDAEIERAALYRVLHRLEVNGNVTSEWDVENSGPARRVYKLTEKGEVHLDEWATVLDHVSRCMARFVRAARKTHRTKTTRRARRRSRNT